MSSILAIPDWKPITTSDLQALNKHYMNLIAGKNEIIYRRYLRDNHDIDCIKKKAAAKANSDEVDPDETFVSKVNVYNRDTSFSAVDNHPIKEFKQYIIFASLLMLNYANPSIKQFVDKVDSILTIKFNIINEQFRLLENNAEVPNYNHFRTIETTCFKKLTEVINKCCKNVPQFSQDIHDKCFRVAFKDVSTAYIFEKAPTYCFTSYHQELCYYEQCENEEIINSVKRLRQAAIGMCVAKKATTTSAKGKGKSKSKASPVETEDDELEDGADEEIAL